MDIDWENWEPVDRATLLFVIVDRQILLIRKKRGLGAGKVNGPGGRLLEGEEPLAGAIRETQEELGVTPRRVRYGGELAFQFLDGYSTHVHVFSAEEYVGEPRETDEAVPMWTPVGAIPYDEMWQDDVLWMPLLLEGCRFRGRFVFDEDRMLHDEIEVED
jgi:8-oxo-dGTP diphosphatase